MKKFILTGLLAFAAVLLLANGTKLCNLDENVDCDDPSQIISCYFNKMADTIHAGEYCDFSYSGSDNATDWYWSFQTSDGVLRGDPASTKERNPRVYFNTPATYQIYCEAKNECYSDNETMYLVVIP